MEWYEAAFDQMYPILYGHRNLDEALDVIEEYGDVFIDHSPILDLASGNGRYLEALLRKDFDAFGIDLSHYLLRSSVEEWGHSGRLVQADMRVLPIADASVGGVINMFTSFGYFLADTDNLVVLREVHRILKTGGVFLLDFINAAKIASNLLDETRRESGGFEIHEKRRIETHGKYLVKDATLVNPTTGQKEQIVERLRLYTRDELVLMLESVGFKIRDIYGDYSRNPFVDGVSERVVIIADK